MAGGLWFVRTAKPWLGGYQVANHGKSLGETHPSATILHVFLEELHIGVINKKPSCYLVASNNELNNCRVSVAFCVRAPLNLCLNACVSIPVEPSRRP